MNVCMQSLAKQPSYSSQSFLVILLVRTECDRGLPISCQTDQTQQACWDAPSYVCSAFEGEKVSEQKPGTSFLLSQMVSETPIKFFRLCSFAHSFLLNL